MERLFQKDSMVATAVEQRLPRITIGILPHAESKFIGMFLDRVSREDASDERGILLLNWRAINEYSTTRLAHIILHELIHAINGTELDAAAYAQAVFPKEKETPSDVELKRFYQRPVGNLVHWDHMTGVVRSNRTGKVLTHFNNEDQ